MTITGFLTDLKPRIALIKSDFLNKYVITSFQETLACVLPNDNIQSTHNLDQNSDLVSQGGFCGSS